MSIEDVFAVSRAGLEQQRLRLEVAARNIATANTPVAPGAQRLEVVDQGVGSFGALLAPAAPSLERADVPTRLVHEPDHPLADAQGMVRYPDVDVAGEMTVLVAAGRAYEANVRAVNALRAMLLKALELGGRS